MLKAFVAYPSQPSEIGREIKNAIQLFDEGHSQRDIHDWAENDICGRFLVEPILGNIAEADVLFADISVPNFNVTFEIGYAVGKGKRLILLRNTCHDREVIDLSEIGIFDTLGYESYSNSEELVAKTVGYLDNITGLFLPGRHNSGRPRPFLIEPPQKDGYDIAVASAVKKSRLSFERYDPSEKGRLPARYAMDCVSNCDAVIARLLPSSRSDSIVHNLRVAFCAGLAHALDKSLLLFQDSEEPVPLDYRELVNWTPEPSSVAPKIGELALALWDQHHEQSAQAANQRQDSAIGKMDFGSPIAENEGRKLDQYFLETAEFKRAKNAEYQVITGRKGSGKTAMFLQLRNSLRRNPKNVILDLQPEGYQLLKFREAVIASLSEGSKEHLLTALWEYVLLLEVAHRLLRDDDGKHLNNHLLLGPHQELAAFMAAYEKSSGSPLGGDFAERLEHVLNDIRSRFSSLEELPADGVITYSTVTELLHRCDINRLASIIAAYISQKDGVWILVDNLDKGWPATGIHDDDLTLARCLQDALHKLEREIGRNCTCRGILFVRSDVYDRLIATTPDKGKIARAGVDLTNPDILEEILRLRIATAHDKPDIDIDEIWPKLCVSHISNTGEDSLVFLIDRSLMRPRCLIELVRACQASAMTLGHDRIEDSDLREGLEAYSVELAANIGFEIRDVYPNAPDILYELLGHSRRMPKSEVQLLVQNKGLKGTQVSEFIDLLLWYGVLGLVDSFGKSHYIYMHRYEMRRLLASQSHLAEDADGTIEINPAFWSALDLESL